MSGAFSSLSAAWALRPHRRHPSPAPDPPTLVDTGGNPPIPTVDVTVLLDGEPVGDGWVSVGGGEHTTTDAEGRATLVVDGAPLLIASHPEARPAVIPVCCQRIGFSRV